MLDLPSVLKVISDDWLKRVDKALQLWERTIQLDENTVIGVRKDEEEISEKSCEICKYNFGNRKRSEADMKRCIYCIEYNHWEPRS